MADPRVISSLEQAFAYEGLSILFTAPQAEVNGVPTRGVGILGAFERGPNAITKVPLGDLAALVNNYGQTTTASSWAGMRAVLAGKWGGDLYIQRVQATGGVIATLNLLATATPVVQVDAKNYGAWGNSVTVQVASGTISGTVKITIRDTATGAIETFDNIDNAGAVATGARTLPTADESSLVNFTRLADGNPDVIAATNLASGANGTAVVGDYTGTSGIQLFETSAAREVSLFCVADYGALTDATINAQVKTSADNAGRWIGFIGVNETTMAVSAAVTDAALYRSDFICYCDGATSAYVRIGGIDGELLVPTNVWVCAAASQTPVNWDITSDAGAVGTSRATRIAVERSTANNQTLHDGSVVHLENDRVLGIHPAASVLTTASQSKRDINYQRTAQFIGRSVAEALRGYQGKEQSKKRRREAVGIAQGFLGTLTDNGNNDAPMLAAARATDEDTATAADKSKGLWVLLLECQLLATFRFMVVKLLLGTNVQVTVE